MHSHDLVFSRSNLEFSPALDDRRSSALAHANSLGMPTRRLEAWHYTDLRQLMRGKLDENFSSIDGQSDVSSKVAISSPYHIHFTGTEVIVSQALINSGAVTVSSILESHDYLLALDESDAMPAYNMALLNGGCDIHVSASLEEPIAMYYSGGQHTRHKLTLSEGVFLQLFEVMSASQYVNLVVDTNLSAHAHLKHTVLHSSGDVVSLNRVSLGADAQFDKHIVCASNSVARHDVETAIQGQGARASLNGVVISDARAHIDLTSAIRHQAGNTTSATLVRSVVADTGRAVFQGKICVDRDAQKVEAVQNSNALLLSEQASMSAKPELEIYADDVACAHGSTIGEIDRDALFFLRSRGIPEDEAIALLLEGFLSEVVAEVDNDDIRLCVNGFISDRLSQLDVSQINFEE